MSKVLSATCVAGIVKTGELPVPGTEILSEGVAESSGILILDRGQKTYIAKTSEDLETTLDKVVDALDDIATTLTQIATSLTSIGAGMTGPTTAPPPTLAADVVQINLKVLEIQLSKTALETLKGALK